MDCGSLGSLLGQMVLVLFFAGAKRVGRGQGHGGWAGVQGGASQDVVLGGEEYGDRDKIGGITELKPWLQLEGMCDERWAMSGGQNKIKGVRRQNKRNTLFILPETLCSTGPVGMSYFKCLL